MRGKKCLLSLLLCLALLSGCAVLLVTLLTVSGHSYRAATRNPVKALRSE